MALALAVIATVSPHQRATQTASATVDERAAPAQASHAAISRSGFIPVDWHFPGH